MIEAPWFQPPSPRPGSCIVIGAGLAGCSVAYALDQLGMPVKLLERGQAGSGASGNPRAILRPHLQRAGGPVDRFNRSAFADTIARLKTLEEDDTGDGGSHIEHHLCGSLQLLDDVSRWPACELIRPVTAYELQALSGELITAEHSGSATAGALFCEPGGWVNLQTLCQALLARSHQVQYLSRHNVTAITPRGSTWRVVTETDARTEAHHVDNVIIAAGSSAPYFLAGEFPTERLDDVLPLHISAGQTTRCETPALATGRIITGRHFLIPEDGVSTLGSTHHRHCHQLEPTPEDDTANLDGVRKLLPGINITWPVVSHWRALRVSTPDRLPVVGALPDWSHYLRQYASLRHGDKHQHWSPASYSGGLYLLTGLGSRGLVNSTLCARILADLVNGTLSERDRQYAALLHPARFAIRRLRREQY